MKMHVTSREAYVIASALYREVKRQQSLPSEKQEWALTEDMRELLQRNLSTYARMLALRDTVAGRTPVDLNGIDHAPPSGIDHGRRIANRSALRNRH